MIKHWDEFQPHDKLAVRRKIARMVEGDKRHELTHEMIELALAAVVPELAHATVDDDEFHRLITEVYAEYRREGGTEDRDNA